MRPESHTFHFNQPLGTADARFGDKEWKTGEAKTKILLHLRIVGDIAKIDKIVRVDNSYDYLLAMPIHQLTREKLDELKEKIHTAKDEFKKTKETTPSNMWLADMTPLKKILR